MISTELSTDFNELINKLFTIRYLCGIIHCELSTVSTISTGRGELVAKLWYINSF